MKHSPLFAFITLLVLAATPAAAHTGLASTHGGGFFEGVAHPFFGMDHLLAMVGVGVWAGSQGGAYLWRVPLLFLICMIVGGIFGAFNLPAPYVSAAFPAALALTGFVLLASWKPITIIPGMIIIAIYAFYHGYSHGGELDATASPLGYAVGFILTTILLHISGMMMAFHFSYLKERSIIRFSGACALLVGGGMLFSVLSRTPLIAP